MLDSQAIANKTITGNLLGSGSYSIYGGNARNAVVTNMVITSNTFSQAYSPKSGRTARRLLRLQGPGQYLVQQHLGHHRRY